MRQIVNMVRRRKCECLSDEAFLIFSQIWNGDHSRIESIFFPTFIDSIIVSIKKWEQKFTLKTTQNEIAFVFVEDWEGATSSPNEPSTIPFHH